MKKTLTIFSLFLILSSAAAGAAGGFEREIPADLAGKPMPGFALEDINQNSATFGDTVSFDQFSGRPLLVYFGSVG